MDGSRVQAPSSARASCTAFRPTSPEAERECRGAGHTASRPSPDTTSVGKHPRLAKSRSIAWPVRSPPFPTAEASSDPLPLPLSDAAASSGQAGRAAPATEAAVLADAASRLLSALTEPWQRLWGHE